MRVVGYVVFFIYGIVGVLTAVIGFFVGIANDGLGAGLAYLFGGAFLVVFGAIIAAPLIAIASYLTMRAHQALAGLQQPGA